MNNKSEKEKDLERGKRSVSISDSMKKYQIFFDNVNDAIYLIDPIDQSILDCNNQAAKMDGYSINELKKMKIYELHPIEERPSLPEKFKEVSQKGFGKGILGLHHITKDGRYIPIEVNATMIEMAGEMLNLSVVRDISERNQTIEDLIQAKEEAEKANMLKDKFVSLVAHDLRSPAGTIPRLLDLILEDRSISFSEKHRRILNAAKNSAEKMSLLINEILNMSRLKSGFIKPKPRLIDLNDLIRRVSESFESNATKKGVKLINNITWGRSIFADPVLFQQVIDNLVSNAIKFSKDGGTITFFIPEGKPNTIAVADTGTGIDPAILPNLFDINKKTSFPGTNGETGTGLGLPLSQEIMKALGGELRVESTIDKGSTFYADLPDKKPKILIVDDEEPFRFEQRIHLSKINVDIIEAADGEEALSIIKKENPDLIITDISMPIMDGLKLLEEIKAKPETESIPVIIVTGLKGMEIRDEAFKKGADDFVPKPFAPEELIPRVRRFL